MTPEVLKRKCERAQEALRELRDMVEEMPKRYDCDPLPNEARENLTRVNEYVVALEETLRGSNL